MMSNREKVIHGLELVKEDIRERFVSGSQISVDFLRIDKAIAMLKESERKTGSWDYGTQCSVCKGTIIPPKDRKVRVNFCPWCGADMRDSYEQEGR